VPGFIEAGKSGLENNISGPAHGWDVAERRQLVGEQAARRADGRPRLWQKGGRAHRGCPFCDREAL